MQLVVTPRSIWKKEAMMMVFLCWQEYHHQMLRGKEMGSVLSQADTRSLGFGSAQIESIPFHFVDGAGFFRPVQRRTNMLRFVGAAARAAPWIFYCSPGVVISASPAPNSSVLMRLRRVSRT
jgi:hypothetical protein